MIYEFSKLVPVIRPAISPKVIPFLKNIVMKLSLYLKISSSAIPAIGWSIKKFMSRSPPSFNRLSNGKPESKSDCIDISSPQKKFFILTQCIKIDKFWVPWSIANLKHLEHLSFNGNYRLHELPGFLMYMTSLKSLDLSDSRIEHLPENISNLKNLRGLDLSNSNLKDLSESFTELQSLEYLNIKFTDLQDIPECLIKLKALEVLEATHKGGDLKFLLKIPNIKEIYLNYNREYDDICEKFDNFERICKRKGVKLEIE